MREDDIRPYRDFCEMVVGFLRFNRNYLSFTTSMSSTCMEGQYIVMQ